MVTIKVAGSLKGVVRVASLESSVGELRAECSRLLGLSDPSSVKLIAGGRNLQDDTKPLRDYHITATSRVLVTKGTGSAAQKALAGEEAKVTAEDARAAQLDRLKAAVDKLAARDGRGLTDKYEFSLENQAGARMSLSDADRRSLVMGLALHDKGRASLSAGRLQDALGELLLAEESFNLATTAVLEGIDNVALLLLDIVWVCYKLRDVRRLGVCSERLSSARRMLERAHGLHQERLRLLHGNFSPEHATYVRLGLLEGIVAFHSEDAAAARSHLMAAQARWQKLQLSETALLQLAEMGYSQVESARALRFSGGDLAAAVNFLTDQRAKQQERKAERKRQRSLQSERHKYDKTPVGKTYVDMESLEQLCQLGYERYVAAEALRQAENDSQAALDVLGDPVKRGALQLGLIAQQMLEEQQGPQHVKQRHVKALTDMGFIEKAARKALAAAGDSLEKALEQLQILYLLAVRHMQQTAVGDLSFGSIANIHGVAASYNNSCNAACGLGCPACTPGRG
eukprot:gene12251-12388_t